MTKHERLIGDDELPDVEAAPPPSDAEMTKVADLARMQVKLIKEIIKLETELAQKLAAYKQNIEVDLPLKLEEIGMTSFSLAGGHQIAMKEMIMAALPKDPVVQEKALTFLEINGHGGVIKHRIQIMFTRGEEAWARKFMADCAKRKKPLALERKDWVEPQTLGALVREQIKAAKAVGADPELYAPTALLGVYTIKKAEVTGPNVPKRKKNKDRDEALMSSHADA